MKRSKICFIVFWVFSILAVAQVKSIPGGEKVTSFEKMSCKEMLDGRYADGTKKNNYEFFDRIYKVLDCSRNTLRDQTNKDKPEVKASNIFNLMSHDLKTKFGWDDRVKACQKADNIAIGFQYLEMMQLLYAIRTRMTIYDQPIYATNSNMFTPGCKPGIMANAFLQLRSGRRDKTLKDNQLIEKLRMNTQDFTEACHIRDNVRSDDVKGWYLGNGLAAEFKDREICQTYIENWIKWQEKGKITEKNPTATLMATKEPCAALLETRDCSVVLQDNFRMINGIRGCMDELYIACLTSGGDTKPAQPATPTRGDQKRR